MLLGQRIQLWLCVLIFGMGRGVPALPAAEPARFSLNDGDRVLFIGDTFFEREVDYGHLETALTASYSDRRLTFRNLSWAGDTPMGKARASFDWNKSEESWLKRVQEQVAIAKPSVAILSYGMTAALELADIPAGEAHAAYLSKFITDTGRLMTGIREASGQPVRFVFFTPIQQQGERPDSNHSKALNEVAEALGNLGKTSGIPVVDILGATRRISMLRMVTYESPVILNDTGYRMLADRLPELLGIQAPAKGTDTALLRSAIQHKNELFFHRWRPANWTYLFGFRKHEQGRNSVEIPQFDPMIAEWDTRIAGLRPSEQTDPKAIAEVRALLAKKATQASAAADSRASVSKQAIPSFDSGEGIEVSLWAENPLLHKPIHMNWDPQGRLWVASSEVYPQIKPGQPAVDSVVVLEDTDGDGKADRHTVFADGLLIPTGVVPDGKGGCYVAASHQLLHLEDTDGDGKADRRTVTLSSFGTEDTHHNLHTLRWGYDGHLYMNQSIYTHTHIETAHGVRRLNSGGIWRFNPDSWTLSVFTRGGCNPWGHHWDQYGNSFFTDGAGGKGIYHAVDGATYFTYSDMRREADSISPGNYPKFASLEVIHSPAFPKEWQENAITCDFRAHRIVRFSVKDSGSSFQTQEQPDLLRSTNVTFRPIDLRLGPDGALYIADWSNPIIQHGEVDFRDPRRDKEHGRIWRVTANASGKAPRRPAPNLTKLSTTDLLDRTLSANGWEQEQSRLVLRQRDAREVLDKATSWVKSQKDPRAALEVVWLHQAFGKPGVPWLTQLTASPDSRLRTAAARQLSH